MISKSTLFLECVGPGMVWFSAGKGDILSHPLGRDKFCSIPCDELFVESKKRDGWRLWGLRSGGGCLEKEMGEMEEGIEMGFEGEIIEDSWGI